MGQSNQIESLVNKGLFKVLYDILNCQYLQIYEQAIWIVGNVSVDSSKYRIEMRRLNFIQIITDKILQQDDFDVIKYSNWALSNLCRGDLTHKSQRESIAAFTKVILTYKDEDMLKDALICLVDLMDKNMIQAFIEAGLVKKLSELSQSITKVHPLIIPIVSIVCLINSGEHEDCSHCVECGFVDILFGWLELPDLKK